MVESPVLAVAMDTGTRRHIIITLADTVETVP